MAWTAGKAAQAAKAKAAPSKKKPQRSNSTKVSALNMLKSGVVTQEPPDPRQDPEQIEERLKGTKDASNWDGAGDSGLARPAERKTALPRWARESGGHLPSPGTIPLASWGQSSILQNWWFGPRLQMESLENSTLLSQTLKWMQVCTRMCSRNIWGGPWPGLDAQSLCRMVLPATRHAPSLPGWRSLAFLFLSGWGSPVTWTPLRTSGADWRGSSPPTLLPPTWWTWQRTSRGPGDFWPRTLTDCIKLIFLNFITYFDILIKKISQNIWFSLFHLTLESISHVYNLCWMAGHLSVHQISSMFTRSLILSFTDAVEFREEFFSWCISEFMRVRRGYIDNLFFAKRR